MSNSRGPDDNESEDFDDVADRDPRVDAAHQQVLRVQQWQQELVQYGSVEGPHFVTEARSLPERSKVSADVSLLRPFGRSSVAGWPFGAIMQVDGQQHFRGRYCQKTSREQRSIDYANDSAAWKACMPVLRIACSDEGLLDEARRVFLLALLANPGVPFIMYTRRFYGLLDWHWATSELRATFIAHMSGLGLFVLSRQKLHLLVVKEGAPLPPPRPSGGQAPPGKWPGAISYADFRGTPAGSSGSGLRRLQKSRKRTTAATPERSPEEVDVFDNLRSYISSKSARRKKMEDARYEAWVKAEAAAAEAAKRAEAEAAALDRLQAAWQASDQSDDDDTRRQGRSSSPLSQAEPEGHVAASPAAAAGAMPATASPAAVATPDTPGGARLARGKSSARRTAARRTPKTDQRNADVATPVAAGAGSKPGAAVPCRVGVCGVGGAPQRPLPMSTPPRAPQAAGTAPACADLGRDLGCVSAGADASRDAPVGRTTPSQCQRPEEQHILCARNLQLSPTETAAAAAGIRSAASGLPPAGAGGGAGGSPVRKRRKTGPADPADPRTPRRRR